MKRQRNRRRGIWVPKQVQNRLKSANRKNWRSKHLKRQGGRCFYCKREIREDLYWFRPTLDHYIPLALGGIDHFENTVTACWRCNKEKADMCGDDFLETLQARGLVEMEEHA